MSVCQLAICPPARGDLLSAHGPRIPGPQHGVHQGAPQRAAGPWSQGDPLPISSGLRVPTNPAGARAALLTQPQKPRSMSRGDLQTCPARQEGLVAGLGLDSNVKSETRPASRQLLRPFLRCHMSLVPNILGLAWGPRCHESPCACLHSLKSRGRLP